MFPTEIIKYILSFTTEYLFIHNRLIDKSIFDNLWIKNKQESIFFNKAYVTLKITLQKYYKLWSGRKNLIYLIENYSNQKCCFPHCNCQNCIKRKL